MDQGKITALLGMAVYFMIAAAVMRYHFTGDRIVEELTEALGLDDMRIIDMDEE